jgi:hypothetical protein
MGLFRKKIADPVAGTLQVTSSSMPSPGAMAQNYHIRGVITGDGIEATAVEASGIVKSSRYPMPGASLPVTVSRSDPTRFKIEWDQVMSSGEQAEAVSEAMAASLRSGGAEMPPGVMTQGIDARHIPGLRDEVQRMTAEGADKAAVTAHVLARLAEHGTSLPPGMAGAINITTDPPPGETPSPVGTASVGATPADDDPAARLQRLEDLKAKGLIGDGEYDALRSKILDDL